MKHAAHAGLAFDLDAPAVLLDDPVADRQAQAGAVPGALVV